MLKKTISIIGSGPSGFYTAYRLLKKSPIPIHIKLWEKLPVPFGLSRYGVAPDHPEVKNCEETFKLCFKEHFNDYDYNNSTSSQDQNQQQQQQNSIEFIGGVTVGGPHIKLKQIIDNQDIVIFSYGCQSDRRLNIPGEQTAKGVFTSREFVNWYNGHFDYSLSEKFNNFPWSKVKNIGIIGNGNVALDLTRILISNQIGEIWDNTDISKIALKNLQNCNIKNIKLIARRDFLNSKFTNKELRELWELEKYGIKGTINKEFFNKDQFDVKNMNRTLKRRIEMCDEYMRPFNERTKKNYKKFKPLNIVTRTWELDYLKTPLRINKDSNGYIKSLTLCHNIITPENRVILQLNEKITYDIDLLITSLGYKGVPLPEFKSLDIGFQKDHISNVEGHVLSSSGNIIPGLYASGWIRKGNQGVIASTMQDSFEIADAVIKDLTTNLKDQTNHPKKLNVESIPHITWSQWESLDKEEHRRGQLSSKPREKFLSIKDVQNHLSSL